MRDSPNAVGKSGTRFEKAPGLMFSGKEGWQEPVQESA